MGSNTSQLDDQIVRQLCRQMQGITQVCEAMAFKLLDLEGRIQQLDSSVQGVAAAIETEGLGELLDTVGGRLGDLKDLLGIDDESTQAVETEFQNEIIGDLLGLETAQDQDMTASRQVEGEEIQEHIKEGPELETVYVDDPQMDLMSA